MVRSESHPPLQEEPTCKWITKYSEIRDTTEDVWEPSVQAGVREGFSKQVETGRS